MKAPLAESHKPTSQKEGGVRKCPNCGEGVPSYSISCSACGHEFRGISGNKNIENLFDSIQLASKNYVPSSGIGKSLDDELYRLIGHWPLPNTKEDLVDFFTRGISHIKDDALDGSGENASTAWLSKCKEAVSKLQVISMHDSTVLPLVSKFEREVAQKEKQMKKHNVVVWLIAVAVIILGYGAIFLFGKK